MLNSNKLVILDRDGVINFDSDDYIKSPNEWHAIPSSLSAIARLNQNGYKVAIATNQSGISRGYFNLTTLDSIHNKMKFELTLVGGFINRLEFCSDHPDKPGPNRKPSPGMIFKLFDYFKVVPQETWFVGDSKSDLDCAKNADCKAALVLTGKGQKTLQSGIDINTPVFDDLSSFVDYLLTT